MAFLASIVANSIIMRPTLWIHLERQASNAPSAPSTSIFTESALKIEIGDRFLKGPDGNELSLRARFAPPAIQILIISDSETIES